MILRDITERNPLEICDFKIQENGFPRVHKLKSLSASRFKRSTQKDLDMQDLDMQDVASVKRLNEFPKQSVNAVNADQSVNAVQEVNAAQEVNADQEVNSDQSEVDLKFLLSGQLSLGHGEEEEKSLQELLDFTRSSSAQIRRRAWGIILKIFKKLPQEKDILQIEKEIEKVDLGLYLRVGLDQKELDEVLEVLEILMGLKDLDQLQMFSRNFMVKIGVSEQLLDKNLKKVNGNDNDHVPKVKEKTFGEIKSLMKKEPMMGLLEGGVMDRLAYLLNTDLKIWNVERILKIILGFSNYSRKSCSEIVKKRILENILKYSRKDEIRSITLQIFLNVIGASRENALEFVKINGLEVVISSIADLQDEDEHLCWMILSYCSRYGITGGVLSDYRPMFYAKAREYFAFSNDEYQLKSRIGLLKCLKDFVFMVPNGFRMGGLDDEMKPFVDILLSAFSWIIDCHSFKENLVFLHLASISAALDFFTAYLSRLESSPSTSDLCKRIYHNVHALYPIFREKAFELAFTPISYVEDSPSKFWQKIPETLSKMIHGFGLQTFGIDFFTSIFDFIAAIDPWISDLLDMKPEIQSLAEYIMEQPQTCWTRFYTQAQTSLITSYLKLFDNGLDEKKKIKTYLHLLSSFQPGQEILCSRALFELFKFLDTSPLNHIPTISNQHKMIMMDIFDKSFYSDSSLKNSSAIHKSDYESVSSLWMEIAESGPTLPLSKFWIYSPIDSFLEEEQNQVTICEEDLSGYIFVIYSLVLLSESCGFGFDLGRLVIATMKVCLLNSLSDEAICLSPRIQECLSYVLNAWDSAEPTNLEPLMGSEINFYQLYSQLLSNFGSSSFGNELWGKLLLIPLHNMYACDYKSLFFTTLEPKILRLITAPLGRDPKAYSISKTDHEKLQVYDKLITSKCIKKDKNPFLYNMLTDAIHN